MVSSTIGNDEFIPERLRAQLLALGIPATNHSREALVRTFPGEFNIGATKLSGEDMARVLIHLVQNNIISAPGTVVPTMVRKVVPGWHFCQFYRDFDQLLLMIAPYIAEGLKNGEACLWVVPEAVTRSAVHAALAECIEGVEAYLAGRQLEILYHRSWYIDPFGKLKSFEEIARALLAKQDEALARGFKFLRAAGDAGWVSGTEQSKDFIDYENKVNTAIGGTQVAAVCTYRADVTADEFVAIVTAHQNAFYKTPTCVSV